MVSVCLPSDALLQHLPSYLGFSYLGCGVSLHGCSSKAQPLLFTLDEGYLLTTAPADLERGVALLGPPAPTQPSVLRFMGSQRVGHDWVTEVNWTELNPYRYFLPYLPVDIYINMCDFPLYVKIILFTTYPSEWLKESMENDKCWWQIWSNWKDHTLLEVVETGTDTSEDCWQYLLKLGMWGFHW